MTDRNISEFMEEKEDGACLTAERPKNLYYRQYP